MSGILQSSAQDPIMASPPRAKAKVRKTIIMALHFPTDLHLSYFLHFPGLLAHCV